MATVNQRIARILRETRNIKNGMIAIVREDGTVIRVSVGQNPRPQEIEAIRQQHGAARNPREALRRRLAPARKRELQQGTTRIRYEVIEKPPSPFKPPEETAAQKALFLQAGEQLFKGTPRFEALRARAIAEEKKKIEAETEAEVKRKFGKTIVTIKGKVSPFAPKTPPKVQEKPPQETREGELPPQIAEEVRQQLASKKVRQTLQPTSPILNIPADTRAVSRFTIEKAEEGRPISFKGAVKTNKIFLPLGIYSPQLITYALEKSREFEAVAKFEEDTKPLKAAGLYFVSSAIAVPAGLFKEITTKDPISASFSIARGTAEFIVKPQEQLTATSPLGKASQAGGILLGSEIVAVPISRGAKSIYRQYREAVFEEMIKRHRKEVTTKYEPTEFRIYPDSVLKTVHEKTAKIPGIKELPPSQQILGYITESGKVKRLGEQPTPQRVEGTLRIVRSGKTGRMKELSIRGEIAPPKVPMPPTPRYRFPEVQETLPQIKEAIMIHPLLELNIRQRFPQPKPPEIPRFEPKPEGKQARIPKTREAGDPFTEFELESMVAGKRGLDIRDLFKSKRGGILEQPDLMLEKPQISVKEPSTILEIERPKPRIFEPFELIRIVPKLEAEIGIEPTIKTDIEDRIKRRQREEQRRKRALITITELKQEMPFDIEKRSIERSRIRQEEEETPRIITAPIPDLTVIEEGTPTTIREKIPEKGKIPLFPDSDKERKRKKVTQLYNSYAREKGRLIKVNKKPNPMNRAKNVAASVVDNTTSAAFTIKKAKKTDEKVTDDFSFYKINKFNKKGIFYIEENKHRIDSIGEFQGITVQVWKARRKNARGLI